MKQRLIGVVWATTCLAATVHAQPATETPPALPMTPGVHMLQVEYELDGQKRTRPYAIFLPHDIQQAAKSRKKYPMVLFLAGLGARGMNLEAAYKEGPIQMMKKRPEYEKTAPYIVVRPMIPPNERSDNPQYAKYAIAAARDAIIRYPIDTDQVHLLGLSMGGEAAWHTALEGSDLFTTVVVAMGRQHPKPDLIAQKLKGCTVLIVAGSVDGDFTVGSRVMAKALEKVGADVMHVEVPGAGHAVWIPYVLHPRLYDWMLLHRRDKKPKQRAGVEELAKWPGLPPDDPDYAAFEKKLQEQFGKFLPWWQVENCEKIEGAGRVEQKLGRTNVFVTHPFNWQVPCRLITTAKIPKGKKTTLYLEVGHEPGGDWQLVVNIDCYAKKRAAISGRGAEAGPWRKYSIDLTPYAGKEVFIELLNRQHKKRNATALWHRIEIVSEDLPQSPPTPAPKPTDN